MKKSAKLLSLVLTILMLLSSFSVVSYAEVIESGKVEAYESDNPYDEGNATEKILSALSIAEMPEKTVYEVGDKISLTGLKIIAHYENGTAAYVYDYTVVYDFTTYGEKFVVINYTENDVTKSCSFAVTVNDPNVPADPGTTTSPSSFADYVLIVVEFFKNVISFLVDLIMAVV